MANDKQILVRMPTEMHDRFVACVKLEAETLGFGEELSAQKAFRAMIRDYITRWESIGASEDARAAGRALANGRKAARRG